VTKITSKWENRLTSSVFHQYNEKRALLLSEHLPHIFTPYKQLLQVLSTINKYTSLMPKKGGSQTGAMSHIRNPDSGLNTLIQHMLVELMNY
jgi:hypothetical protein